MELDQSQQGVAEASLDFVPPPGTLEALALEFNYKCAGLGDFRSQQGIYDKVREFLITEQIDQSPIAWLLLKGQWHVKIETTLLEKIDPQSKFGKLVNLLKNLASDYQIDIS